MSCLPISLDRYGRTVATCAVGGADLGDWLVRNGLALDWPEYSKRKYDAAQRDAEQAGRGIWKDSYIEPWLYRVCIRANGAAVEGVLGIRAEGGGEVNAPVSDELERTMLV